MEELEMNTEIANYDGSDELKDELNERLAEDKSEENAENERNEEEHRDSTTAVDYGEIEKQDLEELSRAFPHLKNVKSITELNDPLRYAALRDLGLTPREAYLATSEPIARYDNRSHLVSSVPKRAAAPAGILTSSELEAARELFSGLSDREIQKLYKKVSR